jgi:hypothetical protein
MQSTIMGNTGSGVEYAGLMPGTRVGILGVSSSLLSRLVLPTVEKLGLIDLRDLTLPANRLVGEKGDPDAGLFKSSSTVGGGGSFNLPGGVAVMLDTAMTMTRCVELQSRLFTGKINPVGI